MSALGPLVGDFALFWDLDQVEAELRATGGGAVEFSEPPEAPARLLLTGADGEAGSGPEIDVGAYFDRLNAMCRTWGARLTVRFYGFHGEVFDAALLERLPEVRALVLNGFDEDVENLEAVGALAHLTSLGLGIFELADKDILARLPLGRLEALTLEETRTKALDLAPLGEARALRHLRVFGHRKNIEAVGGLAELREFAFNPAKGVDLGFLNGLAGLRSLKFVLGGTGTLEPVALPDLEELALTQVRGLAALGDLGRFKGLRRLLIQDQPHLDAITVSPANAALEHVWLHNCPALGRIDGLGTLSGLKSLHAVETGLDLPGLDLPRSLTHLSVFTGRAASEAAEAHAIRALGRIPEAHPEMPFFYK